MDSQTPLFASDIWDEKPRLFAAKSNDETSLDFKKQELYRTIKLINNCRQWFVTKNFEWSKPMYERLWFKKH